MRARFLIGAIYGWLLWSRRLSKEYERLPQMPEAFIYVSIIRIMLNRLA